jgi:hypothetical protein
MPLLESVVSRSEETVDIRLTANVHAVDAVDPHDGQNPDVWIITGPGDPRLVRLEPVKVAGLPDRARVFVAFVTPPLQAGGSYTLASTSLLHLANGSPAPDESVAFVGLPRAPLAGPTAGPLAADVPLPLHAAPDGGLPLLDRRAALHARLETMVQTRLGAFGHLPAFGRTLEPKRQVTAAAMAQEARALAAQVRADPDVLSAIVSVGPAKDAAGVLDVGVDAVPRFDATPLRVEARVVAYPASGSL